jgi:SAM-dependent methyltransferase
VSPSRYLLLEFPILARQSPPLHILEIGCGCGSSLLPVLKGNPSARVTATDLSPTAVQLLREAAGRAGVAQERYTAFACNAADPGVGERRLSGWCEEMALAKTCTVMATFGWLSITKTCMCMCSICVCNICTQTS